jgi:hypothetical protein
MKDVVDKQIPELDSNQDAITLSIGMFFHSVGDESRRWIIARKPFTNHERCSGGNDVGLINLLNSCIYQMGVFTKAQAEAAKLIAEVDKDYAWAKDFDWDALSRGCEGQIEFSKSLATSATFGANLDALLTAAKKKLNNGYGLAIIFTQ